MKKIKSAEEAVAGLRRRGGHLPTKLSEAEREEMEKEKEEQRRRKQVMKGATFE